MEELEKYVNKCYLDRGCDWFYAYKFVKIDGKYGFIFHELETNPEQVFIYEDFPNTEDKEELDFIKSFIPDLDQTCKAKEISEGRYYEITNQIQKVKIEQNLVNKQIKNLVEDYGLDKEV